MNRFVISLLVIIALVNIAFLALFFYPLPKTLRSFQPVPATAVYDRHGTLLYETLNRDTGRQAFIALAEMPEGLKNAFLSTEDKDFYKHSGIDLKAVLRAVWQNVSAGEIVSGGSTITQQVVRNLIGVNQQRTFRQKLKESVLALKIDKFFDKDQIFEVYLNSIYFGGLAYGVESAAWQYFNKSAAHLDLAESAFLAGLPQAPNRYYPFEHFERAKARQQIVLSAMLDNGVISEEEYEQALAETLRLERADFAKKAPHFVDYVLSDCGTNCGSDSGTNSGSDRGSDRGSDGGYKIVTTLDLGMQERVETIVESDLTFLSRFNIENAAAVILDARNSDILAMVGSADYNDPTIQGAVNVATSLRQPGSSIKPLVYAAAFEKGWTPFTTITDEPIQFKTADGLPYSPRNFDLTYHGEVTLAEALAQSLNVPAVRVMDFVGIRDFLQWAERLGITTFDQPAEHYGLSLALGSGEVRLLDLVNAYSVFANHGRRADVRFLLSDDPPRAVSVLQPGTARAISAILSSNELRLSAFGEENPLNLPFPVAAKTGTTRNFRDNWTIGYTDDYAVGVWVGNARGEVMEGVSGITGAGPIFYKVMMMLNEMTGTRLTVSPRGQAIVRPQEGDIEEFRIITPFANDVFLFDITKPAEFQKVKLEASAPAEWFVDGQRVGEGPSVLWPLEKGEHRIMAIAGEEERVVEIVVR